MSNEELKRKADKLFQRRFKIERQVDNYKTAMETEIKKVNAEIFNLQNMCNHNWTNGFLIEVCSICGEVND